MIKNILLTLISLIVIIVITFIILGYRSRSGNPAGIKQGKLTDCPNKPNCVCSEYKGNTEHYIAPLIVPDTTLEIKKIIKESILETGGTINTETRDYLAAVYSSTVFGFVDDLEVRIDYTKKEIHFRSASRVGHSDLGVNRKRVESIKALFFEKIKK